MKRAANSPARNRPRKKAAAPDPVPAAASAAPADSRNVDSLEGAFSLGVGILLIIAALFPRSLKQLLLLSLGGGLLYRGATGHCGVYQTLGIDTTKRPLLTQINEKLGD